MPRDLPLGNGSLLLTFDRNYQIRDIYYPHVGSENHSNGFPFRVGVWCDGQFSWLGPEWEIALHYRPDSLVTNVVARSHALGLELTFEDAVDFHETIFVRRLSVRNLRAQRREARVFHHHDFNISGTSTGDTAYYDPNLGSVIHYKGARWFGVHTCGPSCGVQMYACGRKGAGMEGTWRDAEDGELSGNPIDHGAADSVVGFTLDLPAEGEAVFHYWIAAGENYHALKNLHEVAHSKGPQELLTRTHNYWRLWVGKEDRDFADLPDRIVDLYKRSLLVMRTHIDSNGAVIASSDWDIRTLADDTYCYMWPRDGALAAYALVRAGYSHVARNFFEFCSRVIEPGGYFLHKYNSDGTLASSWQPWVDGDTPRLPIQEDETGLVVWALWEHFRAFRDIEFVKPFYRKIIINSAEFMLKFRDTSTGLPLPSHDLWEERFGVHVFTVAAVCAGLTAAANFAEAFGEAQHARRYRRAVGKMRRALFTHLFDKESGRFARGLVLRPDRTGYDLDMTPDSSVYGALMLGTCDCADAEMIGTARALREQLWVKTDVGGMARYAGDYYHRVDDDTDRVPGNPWFISTLWHAQYLIMRAETEEELRAEALPILEWVADHALPSGVLAEQVHPYTNAPLSVSPLTWSHGTAVLAVLDYLEKRKELARARQTKP